MWCFRENPAEMDTSWFLMSAVRSSGTASVIAMSRAWWKPLAFPTMATCPMTHVWLMHDHLSDPIRPKELRTGILRHTAGFSHVLARGTWVYVDFIDMKVFGPYLPSGSSAVRAISKTLGERGIPLTSNQIQHLGPLGPVTQATDKPWHGE